METTQDSVQSSILQCVIRASRNPQSLCHTHTGAGLSEVLGGVGAGQARTNLNLMVGLDMLSQCAHV